MKNPYKRTDVFTCNYSDHSRFEGRVSAFHVLKVKKCFPQGCLYFHWSCSRKNKGLSCKRGFNYIGRLCQGCSFYQDEKRHCQPNIIITESEWQAFQCEVESFDEWLQELQGREVETAFRIDAVKPRFIKEVQSDHGRVRLAGYLLIMSQGFVDREFFQDTLYAIVSPNQQEQHAFAPEDEVEARALITLDRGRPILSRLRAVAFEKRSGQPTWNNSRALVARSGASYFSNQSGGCLQCPHGALVDVTVQERGRSLQRRDLYCLAGMPEQYECYVYALHKVDVCHQQ